MDMILGGIVMGCVLVLGGWVYTLGYKLAELRRELKGYKRSMGELENLNEYLIISEKLTPCTVCKVAIPATWVRAFNPTRHLYCRA